MGKRKEKKKSSSCYDTKDDDSMDSLADVMSELTFTSEKEEKQLLSLDSHLDELYEERGSTREKALSSIIETFTNYLPCEFADENFDALLCRYLNSIKRGSAKEISLASNAIGLLALTTGFGDNACELFKKSLTPLSKALTFEPEASKISCILDCLAIITFVGGNDPGEIERAMQIIWQFIDPKSCFNVVVSKESIALIKSASSAWSFILTGMDGWHLGSKCWQELVSHFSSLLEEDERSVRIAAGEALALLLEIERSEEFSDKAMKKLEEEVLIKALDLSSEAGGRGSAKKNLSIQRNLFSDIIDYIKVDKCPETSLKIGRDLLCTSKWSASIQLNFLKDFLKGGFLKHMKENKLLHDMFDYTPGRHVPVNQRKLSSTEKRMYKSPNSAVNKQMAKELRMLRSQRTGGHFTIE